MLRIVHLTQFILQINALIDTGKHHISIETIEEHIKKGDLLPYLQPRLAGSDIDLSHLQADPQAVAQFQERLQGILGGYKGREHRKWGVENSGLCLLVAWATELIQQRAREEQWS